MRVLLTEIYRLLNRITGSRLFAYFFGIFLLSILNFVIVNGVALLIRDWISAAGMLLRFFHFPLAVVTFAAFFGATYWLTPSLKELSRDKSKSKTSFTLLLYAVAALLLFLYARLGDSFFS